MPTASTSAMAKSSLAAGVLLVGAVVVLMRSSGVGDTLERWGLLGTWASECGPPGADAPSLRTTYARRGGGATIERRRPDPAPTESGTVNTATIGGDGTLTLTVDLPSAGGVRVITLSRSGHRVRTMAERGSGGYAIRDGRTVQDGSETPWQQRCDG